jgi:hypothetical protein
MRSWHEGQGSGRFRDKLFSLFEQRCKARLQASDVDKEIAD